MAKTNAQLDREIAELTGVMTAREVNAIVRAADGRNVYLIRHRFGEDTVHRVTQARRRDRVMEVHDLNTGRWLPVMPELGDKLEIR